MFRDLKINLINLIFFNLYIWKKSFYQLNFLLNWTFLLRFLITITTYWALSPYHVRWNIERSMILVLHNDSFILQVNRRKLLQVAALFFDFHPLETISRLSWRNYPLIRLRQSGRDSLWQYFPIKVPVFELDYLRPAHRMCIENNTTQTYPRSGIYDSRTIYALPVDRQVNVSKSVEQSKPISLFPFFTLKALSSTHPDIGGKQLIKLRFIMNLAYLCLLIISVSSPNKYIYIYYIYQCWIVVYLNYELKFKTKSHFIQPSNGMYFGTYRFRNWPQSHLKFLHHTTKAKKEGIA